MRSVAQDSATGVPVVPAARGGIVSRQALWKQLDAAGRVTVVSAPPGSGKTFLLRSWIVEAGLSEHAAWVSVLPAEGDPQRFWIAVADALRSTAAGGALVRPLSAAPDLDGWVIVERLLADLGSLEDRVWLVIDDVHELVFTEALRQLELLVLRAPPQLRFVLATRHDVQLGLHRLRLEGELTEIRAADLRFTLAEARAMFDAAGVTLLDVALAQLQERTEGWAAGLRLAALSLAGHPEPVRFAEEFSGSERTVADYLLAEVLERQPEEARRLLLRTSVLERVNGELANLLTGDSHGERVLQDLERAGAFVVPLGPRRSWFRYHQLFAELLQLELRRTEPGEVPLLHAAAAGWFAGHDYPAEAVRHAQAAGDWGLAARLLSDAWLSLTLDGQQATAHELLTGFPAALTAKDPELIALAADRELARGSLEEAEGRLARATGELASVPAQRRGRFQVTLGILRLSLARQRGDVPAVAEEAQRLLAPAAAADAAELGMSGERRGLALISLGIAESWTARSGDAEQHLEQGVTLARQAGRPYLELIGLAHRARIAVARSVVLGAQRSMEAIELAGRHGWGEEPITGVACVQLAGANLIQGQLGEVERWLERAERILRAELEPAAGVTFHWIRAGLERARGRPERALDEHRAAERLAELMHSPFVSTAALRADALQTLVRVGQTDSVESALAQMDDQERDTAAMRGVLAALQLAGDDPQAATVALAPVIAGSVPSAAPLWLVEALLLEAMARDALGDRGAAERALERALDVAEPDHARLHFLIHPVRELLERHLRQRTAHAVLIAEILSMLDQWVEEPGGNRETGIPPVRGTGGRSSGRIEPLSQAEIRVLRYLPTHLPVPEIAGQLHLSVNTIRTHMRHVYDKLGAHTRHDAVERARALGLLAPSPRGT